MNVISRYAEYAAKMTGSYEQKQDNFERLNYRSKDDLMLRGNNRKNTYNSERVRIGSNGRKR
ncbi:hypothetical protein [Clostridium sp.]|uniref:hypothetical protein n=1 Tax=Clostridium sp. TaxID=1506 RepID=UPI0025C0CF3D|nr:hypothetical protein [Clostridium sp.]